MSNPKDSELELNFDGLCDTLTNLVGMLILIVFLLFQTTHELTADVPPQLIYQKTWQQHGQKRSLPELNVELTRLEQQLKSLDGSLTQHEQGLPAIQQGIEELKGRLKGHVK